tara:strand:- start:216 stop:1175 length:960 start_codon:yes stop_codon:yes gene_type:complete
MVKVFRLRGGATSDENNQEKEDLSEEPELDQEEQDDEDDQDSKDESLLPLGDKMGDGLKTTQGIFNQLLSLNYFLLIFVLIGVVSVVQLIYAIYKKLSGDKKAIDMTEQDKEDTISRFGSNVISSDQFNNFGTDGGVFHFIINVNNNNTLWEPDNQYWKYLMIMTDSYDSPEELADEDPRCWSETSNQYPGIWIHPYRNDLLVVVNQSNQNSITNDGGISGDDAANLDVSNRWLIENFPLGKYFYMAVALSNRKLDIYMDGNLRLSVPLNLDAPDVNSYQAFLRDKPSEGLDSTFNFTLGDVDISTVKRITSAVESRNN